MKFMDNHTTRYTCLSCKECLNGGITVCKDAIYCYIERIGFFGGGYIERGCIYDNKTDLSGKFACRGNLCNWNEGSVSYCLSWILLYVILTLIGMIGCRYFQRRSDFKQNGTAMIPRFRRWERTDSIVFWSNNILLLILWLVFAINQCSVFF